MSRPRITLPRPGRQVTPERTGWRDQGLSERHRMWGKALPAVDLDFLLIEMDRAKACAIIEYKGELSQPQLPSHPSYLALSDLGNRAGVPVFAVRYAHNFVWFRVIPLNHFAKKIMPDRRMMNERQYVTLLYTAGAPQENAVIAGLARAVPIRIEIMCFRYCTFREPLIAMKQQP